MSRNSVKLFNKTLNRSYKPTIRIYCKSDAKSTVKHFWGAFLFKRKKSVILNHNTHILIINKIP